MCGLTPCESRRTTRGAPHGRGHIGFVVEVPRDEGGYDTFFASEVAPGDFLRALFAMRPQNTFIHPLELFGILAPYLCPELSDMWGGADVLYFGDNEAANGAAIKGTSGA